MRAYNQESERVRIVKGVSVFALVVSFFTDFGLNCLMGQAKEPAPVFRPALDQIRSQTQIAIRLPSKLPSDIREGDIKLAWGTVSEDGYFISLDLEEIGSDAAFAAGFGGSTRVLRHVANTRPVALAGGLIGMFRPVSCGGSCARKLVVDAEWRDVPDPDQTRKHFKRKG